MSEDQRVTRPGNRTVGFAEYGDPNGFPVVFFHGTPGSRIGGRLAGGWAREAGCRLVALDRPGFGLSTFHEDVRLQITPRMHYPRPSTSRRNCTTPST